MEVKEGWLSKDVSYPDLLDCKAVWGLEGRHMSHPVSAAVLGGPGWQMGGLQGNGIWRDKGTCVHSCPHAQMCSQLCAHMGGFSQEELCAQAHEVGCRQYVQSRQDRPLCSV